MTLYTIYYVYYMLFCVNVFYGKYIIIIIIIIEEPRFKAIMASLSSSNNKYRSFLQLKLFK